MSNRRDPTHPTDVATCSDSLLHAGTCCFEPCLERATVAVLDPNPVDGLLVEHIRCAQHAGVDPALTKPLLYDPTWEPPGRHDHHYRRLVDGEEQLAVLAVQPSGHVVASEAAMVALMEDAGWERLS